MKNYRNSKYYFKCQTCGNEFIDSNYIKNRKFCSNKCPRRKQSVTEKKKRSKLAKKLGFGKWMKNKKRTQETKDKIKIATLKRFENGMPKKTKEKLSKYTGEKSSQWKGGITDFGIRIRNNEKGKEWKQKILYRDNYCCVKCQSKKKLNIDHYPISFKKLFYEFITKHKNINIHNVIKKAETFSKFWDINNGRTLCFECHKKTKNFGLKSKNKHV